MEDFEVTKAQPVQKPSIGRMVIYTQPDPETAVNGAREHPAVITRVWSEHAVNLMVFFDNGSAVPRTSVGMDAAAGLHRWRWPEKV